MALTQYASSEIIRHAIAGYDLHEQQSVNFEVHSVGYLTPERRWARVGLAQPLFQRWMSYMSGFGVCMINSVESGRQ